MEKSEMIPITFWDDEAKQWISNVCELHYFQNVLIRDCIDNVTQCYSSVKMCVGVIDLT